MGKLEDQQRSHVVCTFFTVGRYMEDVEEIAVSGKSPNGVGQALSPLPPEIWQALRDPLTRMLHECESMAEAVDAPELRQRRTRAPLSATITWISVMLGRIEEALDELRPEIMGPKYGEIPNEMRESFAEGVRRALLALGEARGALSDASTRVNIPDAGNR